MDPITALLCGAGSAFLLLGGRGAIVSALVLCAAFYGVYRATRSRAALGLMAPLTLADWRWRDDADNDGHPDDNGNSPAPPALPPPVAA